jgi:hypothetical protein
MSTTIETQSAIKVWNENNFHQFVDSLARRLANDAVDLWKVGQQCVYKAYSSADGGTAFVQYALDTLPEYARKALVPYFKKAGLLVNAPAQGSKRYTVPAKCVLDPKHQSKAFEFVRTTPVMAIEQKTGKKAPAPKVLTGTAFERAKEALAKAHKSLIERLKKDDPEAGALVNNLLVEVQECVYFDVKGRRNKLSKDQVELIELILSGEVDVTVNEAA